MSKRKRKRPSGETVVEAVATEAGAIEAGGGAPTGEPSDGEPTEQPSRGDPPADDSSPEAEDVVEMHVPDDPDFSLLERSVLILAPTDELAGTEASEAEVELASLSKGARAMRWLSPRLLGVALFIFMGAGVAGTVVTLLNPFRDWVVHLLMYTVIFSFFLLYLKAHARRRGILRVLMMLITVALSGFFAWILVDYIPAQRTWYAGRSFPRGEMTELWLPIGLLLGGSLLLLVHALIISRFVRRGRL